jgi:hypothetical protein
MLLRVAEIHLLLQIAKRHRASCDRNVYNGIIYAAPAEDVSVPVLLTIQVDSVSKPGKQARFIPANVAQAINFYQLNGLLHGRRQIDYDRAFTNWRYVRDFRGAGCRSLFGSAHIRFLSTYRHRASTFDAARLLKAENEWGSLQPGRQATLLIVAGNPAERISDTRKIEIVIQNGKLLDRAALKYDAKKDPGYRVVPGLFNP